ncbi:MAG: hypothetical protein HY306_08360 [Nitrosomonadales bacterium]|nr:hypothetical protein [Nitrosomonadales bacterium]
MSKLDTTQEQQRYATLLYWGSRSGLAISTAAFLAYAFGLLPAYIPLDQLPHLWQMPSHEYLAATNTPTGWHWMSMLQQGDFASLFGIAWLSSCSLLCLMAVIPIYSARRDWIYAGICISEIGILVLAASGILTAGH